jgi:hypothetical protein
VNYADDIASDDMIYLPAVMMIVSGILVILASKISEVVMLVLLMGGSYVDMATKDRFRLSEVVEVGHTHIHTQQGDVTRLLLFFLGNKEIRLKMIISAKVRSKYD